MAVSAVVIADRARSYKVSNVVESGFQRNSPGHAALRKGRVSWPNQVYMVTATTLGRRRAFDDFRVACAVARCFADAALLGDATMLAWVLMPDHFHWLIRLGEQESLGAVVNRLKSISARKANMQLGRQGALWSPGYHDHALRAEENLVAAARYLVANPLRAGLVKRVGKYSFWDAVWLPS